MCWKAFKWARRQPIDNAVRKGVLKELAARHNEDRGGCWITHEKLASDVGCRERAARSAVSWLADAGYIEVSQRRKGSRQGANWYRVLWEQSGPDDPEDVSMHDVHPEPVLSRHDVPPVSRHDVPPENPLSRHDVPPDPAFGATWRDGEPPTATSPEGPISEPEITHIKTLTNNNNNNGGESATDGRCCGGEDEDEKDENGKDAPREGELIGGLAYPYEIPEADQGRAYRLIRDCGDMRQVLLDELTGKLRHDGATHPLRYLRGLVKAWREGRFEPLLAPEVARARSMGEDYEALDSNGRLKRWPGESAPAHVARVNQSIARRWAQRERRRAANGNGTQGPAPEPNRPAWGEQPGANAAERQAAAAERSRREGAAFLHEMEARNRREREERERKEGNP